MCCHPTANHIAQENPELLTRGGKSKQEGADAFMRKLRAASRRGFGVACKDEEPAVNGTKMRFDFYVPSEGSAVEFALGERVRQFEKDLWKVLLAQRANPEIRALVVVVRRGKRAQVFGPARQEIIGLAQEKFKMTVEIRDLNV